MGVTIELAGLAVYGYHGVDEHERRDGQPFLFDIRIEASDAPLSDRIEDAVDYRLVAEVVREVSDGRAFNLLEALAAAVADAIRDRFQVESVSVRVRKPRVGLPVEYSAATVTRP